MFIKIDFRIDYHCTDLGGQDVVGRVQQDSLLQVALVGRVSSK
jgi:hypothetical protein